MTEGAKLVTSEPDSPAKEDTGGALDTKLPVALPGVSHEHLEAIDGDRDKEKDKKYELHTAGRVVHVAYANRILLPRAYSVGDP